MDVYAMLHAQSETILKLQADYKKTVQEALAIIQKHQHAVELGAIAISMLEAKVKKLECEALDRSWKNGTEGTQQKGG
jgi:hypothetical protein